MTFARTPDPCVDVTHLSDGVVELRSGLALPPLYQSLGYVFAEVAAAHPDRVFMKQRDPGGAWRGITYAQARLLRTAPPHR